jgi:fatty-acyl-CoA synthase
LFGRLGLEGWSLLLLVRSGGLRPMPARRIFAVLRALDHYGISGARR